MSNLVIEMLRNKRDELLSELGKLQEKYGAEISEINQSLVKLTGKSVPELEAEYRYDDENPNYIKGTEDGI